MKRPLSHPTLLISGIAGGSASLLPLRWYLRSQGIDARIWPTPFVLAYPVRHYGKRLARTIAAEYAAGPPLTLVGWSMGGYIAVDAMSEAEAAARVSGVIAFGTPFDGTEAALIPRWLHLKINVSDFAPGSGMLARLRTVIAGPARRWRFDAINGDRDALAPGPLKTIPAESALSGPYSHISLGFDPLLFAHIAGLIREPR